MSRPKTIYRAHFTTPFFDLNTVYESFGEDAELEAQIVMQESGRPRELITVDEYRLVEKRKKSLEEGK